MTHFLLTPDKAATRRLRRLVDLLIRNQQFKSDATGKVDGNRMQAGEPLLVFILNGFDFSDYFGSVC